MLALLKRTPLSLRSQIPSVSGIRAYSATSGYGDEDQTGYGQSTDAPSAGVRNRIDTEHPGPPPPGPPPVGEGKGAGSGGVVETRKPSSMRESRSGNGGGSGKEAQSEDVKQHNKEMAERYGRANNMETDQKVEKGFWSDIGGRDRDP
ncbi:hypothetical protein L873DRAFT_569241 [Choiromyces venosus 120613-1]|uniref:Uncharacterized protein n=1 Tax=Choiromyces venosus 120613-1 TaxID=1336337 RepID=A0A3N4JYP1_9PEZI|nr:hypothetical protein L873DRAFT_569241 [Choiromyces venosus 120613-1]